MGVMLFLQNFVFFRVIYNRKDVGRSLSDILQPRHTRLSGLLTPPWSTSPESYRGPPTDISSPFAFQPTLSLTNPKHSGVFDESFTILVPVLFCRSFSAHCFKSQLYTPLTCNRSGLVVFTTRRGIGP